MDIPVTDICSFLGLCATVALTTNFLLGLLLSTAYKRHPYWKKVPPIVKKVSVFKIHNITAYVALVLILLHPLVLVFDPSTKFHLKSILLPFFAPVQQVWAAVGVISMYCFVLVIITSQKVVRKFIGYRVWKNIHLISFLSIIMICLHGVFMDTQLKDREPDFIDAEKLLSELCLLALLGASILRYRYYRLHQLSPAKNAAIE